MSRRTLSSAVAILVAATAIGCSDGPTSPTVLVGNYRLANIDLVELPTPEACAVGLTVLNGHLVLDSHAGVTLAQTDFDELTGWNLTYSGAGTWSQQGSQLLLDLTERWSDDPTVYHRKLTLDVDHGELLMHGLGAPCDGNSTAHYQFVDAAR